MRVSLRWMVVPIGLALAGPPASLARAQQKPAPPPPSQGRGQAATPSPVAPPAVTPGRSPAEDYSYKPEGRRDPFLSLTSRLPTGTGRAPGKRPEGLAGAMVGELVLKGILQNRGAFVAMVQGPDGKTYLVHPGERFLDGVVKTITPDSLVILQEVADPLSLTKQREVRKTLRVVEEVK